MEKDEMLFLGACMLLIGEGGIYGPAERKKAIQEAEFLWQSLLEWNRENP